MPPLPTSPSSRTRRMRLLSLLVAIGLVATACGGGGQEAAEDSLPATPLPPEQDPGLVHVHGFGVNPADGMVQVATHFGLWHLPEEGQAERVGDAAYDLMGFTVVGPDHFQASGHPLMVDDLPPLLGLIESTDGGRTWRSVSLLGEVDFHALRVAHDRVYGWNATDSTFMVSADGVEWDQRSIAPIVDFVLDPEDPDGILASVSESFEDIRLVRSVDGGGTWEEEVESPPVARLAWESPSRLWGVGIDGSVWRSHDGGGQWEPADGRVGGRPDAFLDTGESLYVAAGGSILQSDDGGHSWVIRHREQ